MKPATLRNSQRSTDTEVLGTETAEFETSTVKHSSGVQRVLNSRQLFSAADEILIEHAGFIYRLRITQANKLILTK